MQLPPDILFHHLSYTAPLDRQWYEWLSESERALVHQFSHEKRQLEFVAGRAALRILISQQQGFTPQDIQFEIEASGALRFTNAPESLISVSHGHGEVAAVMADTAIGVDLEPVRLRRPDLWRYILHPDEHEWWQNWAWPLEEKLIVSWVIKEAVLKGMRTGFRYSPKKLTMAIPAFTRFPSPVTEKTFIGNVSCENGQNWNVWCKRGQTAWIGIAKIIQTPP